MLESGFRPQSARRILERRRHPRSDDTTDCCAGGFVFVGPHVPVNVERRPRRAVAHTGLNGLHVTTTADQQGREVVPQAVKVMLVYLAHLVHGAVNDPGAYIPQAVQGYAIQPSWDVSAALSCCSTSPMRGVYLLSAETSCMPTRLDGPPQRVWERRLPTHSRTQRVPGRGKRSRRINLLISGVRHLPAIRTRVHHLPAIRTHGHPSSRLINNVAPQQIRNR